VLDLIGLPTRLRGADLVVTGEGTVDHSTWLGKAPAGVRDACSGAGVRCAIFGGRLTERPKGVELYELSGNPARAREDLVGLGTQLARAT
jgi:glycerate kinase